MRFLKSKNFFWIFLIITLMQMVKITHSYSQTSEVGWEGVEALNEFGKILSKGTSKSEVLNYLGRPDKTEKSSIFGYEVLLYNNFYLYDLDMGSFGIVFVDDKIVDVSDEMFPPAWVGPKQVMKSIFFPAYVFLAIPGFAFMTVPFALFCLIGVFMLEGWMRYICIYFLLAFASMIIPWFSLVFRK